MGANGAGKSTLIKIISGVYRPDEGTIRVGGTPTRIRSPHHAHELGIATIFQDVDLVPELSATENLSLGRELTLGRTPLLHRKDARQRAEALFQRLGVAIDPATKVRDLSLAEQEIVAISRALALDARILILDEPTAVLSRADSERLFALIQRLKQQGVGIIYISHELEESQEIGDRATVLRDGKLVASVPIAGTSTADLVELVVGKRVDLFSSQPDPPEPAVVLEVQNLRRPGRIRDVTFQAHRGEIVCITGLIGSGKEDVGRALFGDLRGVTGGIRIHGRRVALKTARSAIASGIGYAPANRREAGLVATLSVQENMFLPALSQYTVLWGILWRRRLGAAAQKFVDLLSIRTRSVRAEAQFLSGGNQQKVVLAKWLATNSQLLVLVEPTNGLDVGAKADVYRLIHGLARDGVTVVVISSEIPEALGVGHRILVMRGGRIVAEFDRATATQESLLTAAVSGSGDAVRVA